MRGMPDLDAGNGHSCVPPWISSECPGLSRFSAGRQVRCIVPQGMRLALAEAEVIGRDENPEESCNQRDCKPERHRQRVFSYPISEDLQTSLPHFTRLNM